MPGRSPIRPIAYAQPRIACEKARDGSLRLRSIEALRSYTPSLARLFRAAVERNPEGLFLAERDNGGHWRKLSYAAARELVDRIGQALLERGLGAERPL